jgi:hypothetical protein
MRHWQIVDRSLQQYSNLVLSGCALGVLVWSNHRGPTDLRIGVPARGIEDIKAYYAAASPVPLKRLIKRNAREPSR